MTQPCDTPIWVMPYFPVPPAVWTTIAGSWWGTDWLVSPRVMAAAQRTNESLIQALGVCQAFNTWRTGYEATREFSEL